MIIRFISSKSSPEKQDRVRSYLSRGCYGAQIRRFLRHFTRDQMLLLRTEDLETRHEATLDTVCDFLGIERFTIYPEPRMLRPTDNGPELPLSSALRDSLGTGFRRDLLELHRLSGLYVEDWLV